MDVAMALVGHKQGPGVDNTGIRDECGRDTRVEKGGQQGDEK